MMLYHGSTVEIRNPEIIKTEIGRDFGFAFYTTDIMEQAERWAVRKVRIASRRSAEPVKAVVNVYEWDEDASVKIKAFDGTSLEWLDFVVKCRSDLDFIHEYDIVTGKIANDNVGETVSYVVQGIMRREDAVERLKFEKVNNQIAFCSETSLKTLKFVKSYEVEVK